MKLLRIDRRAVVWIVILSTAVATRFIPYQGIVDLQAQYYAQVGAAYLTGTPLDSLNPEHPPLAKYIAGIFALYSSWELSSRLFSVLSILILYLIGERVFGKGLWSLIPIWIATFEPLFGWVSWYPELEIFAIFFGLTAFLLLLKAGRLRQYILVGVALGLALACKLSAISYVIPALIYMGYRRRFVAIPVIVVLAALTYLLTYMPLLVSEGLTGVIGVHSTTGTGWTGRALIWYRALSTILLYTTTYGYVGSFVPSYHPEAFSLFDADFVSRWDVTNPLVNLMLVPALTFSVQHFRRRRNDATFLTFLFTLTPFVFLTVTSNVLYAYSILTPFLCILVSQTLRNMYERRRWLVYRYLIFTPIYLVLSYFLMMAVINLMAS